MIEVKEKDVLNVLKEYDNKLVLEKIIVKELEAKYRLLLEKEIHNVLVGLSGKGKIESYNDKTFGAFYAIKT